MERTGWPWYDDDLMELRAEQRRWLSAIRPSVPATEVPQLDVDGLDAIRTETRWRQTIHALISTEWRTELDAFDQATTATQLVNVHRAATDGAYIDSNVTEGFHRSITEARRKAGSPGVHRNEYAGLRYLLEVAEVLAAAADDAAGRPHR